MNKEYLPDGFSFDYGEIKGLKIKSIADYSVNDACLALEAIYTLKDRFIYDEEKVKQGLASISIPCRLEIVNKQPRVIVDGAHNPEAVDALCKNTIHNVTEGKPIHVVFACFRDKNLGNMLSSLGAITDDLTMTTFDHPRARKEEEYFLFLGDYKFEEDAKALIKSKMNEFPDDVILVTGSLAFAALVRRWFRMGEI